MADPDIDDLKRRMDGALKCLGMSLVVYGPGAQRQLC